MPDEIDRVTENDAILIAAYIHNASRVVVEYPPKGSCYNCAEPLAEPLRYCDGDCAEDHRKRERRK